MTVAEAFNSHDMDSIIDRMTAYVYIQLRLVGIKDLEGQEPVDIVQDVLIKVAQGDRDWSKARCNFIEFLFGCLKSHLHNFFKKFKSRYDYEMPELSQEEDSAGEVADLKNTAIETLKDDGADDQEIQIFECWTDGIIKPSDVSRELNLEITTTNNAVKRLMRKMPNLQIQLKKYGQYPQ